MRALAAALTLLLAGCVDPSTQPVAVSETAPPMDAGVVVHLADGTLGSAAVLPEPVVAVVRALGAEAFEPTLGVHPDGTLFYAALAGPGPAVGYVPTVLRSADGGLTWEDVSPSVGPVGAPPETNDPFLYADPDTGRVFQFAMAPILVCSILSWSDDRGDTWTTNPRGCGNTPAWDHQSMTATNSQGTPTLGYSKILVQCINGNTGSECARSLDGGLTWAATTPAFPSLDCGGLHGHPVAHPDGTVYLPKMDCGRPSLAISDDDGLTWTQHVVSETPGHPWPDPAMAVDADGNVYYAWIGETGALLLSVSADAGASWSEPVVASPPGLTTHIPALAAGDAGRIVLAYPGTPDLPKGYASTKEEQEGARWHGYLTIAQDALAPNPTFVTVRATPAEDPLVRGACGPERCPGMVDFIDVVVAPDGRPYASFVDACDDACAAAEGEFDNAASDALLVTMTSGPLLRG